MKLKFAIFTVVLLASLSLSGCATKAPNATTDVQPTKEASSETSEQKSSENVTQIELILDDSGSMAGLLGGKAKIDIAKESLNKIIDELKVKNNLQVAFRIYGHQTKECTNSVVEMPMGKIQADQMKSVIGSLKPLGSTPIYYSLTESAKDFNPSISGDKVVILVTDGLESCGGDPCAAAKALLAGGVVNKMHVVGFGLSKSELSTLQCIVDPFKGSVVGASNSTEFLKSMQQIMEKSVSPDNLEVSVFGADNKPLQASEMCVYKAGQTDAVVSCAGYYASEHAFSLNPGSYDLMVVNSGTKAESWIKNIKITAGELVKKSVSFAEGSIKISVVDVNQKPLEASDICVYQAGQTDKSLDCAGYYTADHEFKLLPQQYDIKVINAGTSEETWLKNVEVKPSQTTEKTVTFQEAALTVEVVDSAGEPIEAGNICVYPQGQTENEVGCAGFYTSNHQFKLKPGVYDIKINSASDESLTWSKGITLKAGQEVTEKITPAGK